MGICYGLICRDCKRKLDLEKSRIVDQAMNGIPHPTLLRLADQQLLHYGFRFLRRHWGHDVDMVHSESDEYGYVIGTYRGEFDE